MTDFVDSNLDAEFFEDGEPEPEIVEDYDQPEAGFVKGQYRGPVAKSYEKKAKEVLNTLFRITVQHESTIPDAANIIMYGPNLAEKTGDYAAVNKTIRRGVDMLTGGTDNPMLGFALALSPMVLQTFRNHQDVLSPSAAVESFRESRKAAKQRPAKRVKIPFTNRYLELRFQWKLFKLESVTNDPHALAVHVFSNPEILSAMEKAGLTLPFNMETPNPNGATGKRSTKA